MNSVSIKSPANINMLPSVSRLVVLESLRMMIEDPDRPSCPNVKGSDIAVESVGVAPFRSWLYLSEFDEVEYVWPDELGADLNISGLYA